jgi:hypothetical protein
VDLSDVQRKGLNTALSEATCLEIDVDRTNLVFRVTLDVLTLPESGPAPQDRTVVVTCSGISRIAASLRTQALNQSEPLVLPLTLDELPEALHSFGGCHLHGWEFIDLPESSWTQWGDLLSFDTALAEDAAPHVLELSQEEGMAPRELDLRVWFTSLQITDRDGNPVDTQEFIDGGRRWWAAHDANDPRTRSDSADVAPPL